MDNLTIYHIPEYRLYQFDSDKYVWKTKLNSTRSGSYPAREPIPLTEVYEKEDDNLRCVASGSLYNSKYSNGPDEFTIFDYDVDTSLSFRIKMPLKEADKKTYQMLRDNLAEVKEKRSK